MFSTDFIFRQQENLVDNQKFQAGFRPLCNKILLRMANPCLRLRLLLQFDGKSAARYYAIEPSTFSPTFSLKFYDKGKTAF